MISAYAIRGNVWIVRTDETAQETMPETLPMGSFVLDPDEAAHLGVQVLAAALVADERTVKP